MKFFSRKGGVGLMGGDCLEEGFFALTWNFKKGKNIYKVLQFFLIFKIIFLKYRISVPFSLVEAKTHVFNIHIG